LLVHPTDRSSPVLPAEIIARIVALTELATAAGCTPVVLTIPALVKPEQGNQRLTARRLKVNAGLLGGGHEDALGDGDGAGEDAGQGSSTSTSSASGGSIPPFRCIDIATQLDTLRAEGDEKLYDSGDMLHLSKVGTAARRSVVSAFVEGGYCCYWKRYAVLCEPYCIVRAILHCANALFIARHSDLHPLIPIITGSFTICWHLARV
jgi:hypothetical protein